MKLKGFIRSSLIASLTGVIISTTTLTGQAASKGAYPAISRIAVARQVDDTVQRLSALRSVLGPSLDRSVLARSSKKQEVVDRAGSLETQLKQLRRDLESGQPEDQLRGTLSSAMVDADQINVVVRNVDLGDLAEIRWGQARSSLNTLAAIYGIEQLPTRSLLGRSS